MDEHETWKVQDSSKLQDYLHCPRFYLFKHGFGWSESRSTIHREFGSAWHLAQEDLLLKGYTPEGIAAAFSSFYKHYRSFFTPEDDVINEPKTPANVLRALSQYCNKYKDDDFTVSHIEAAGTLAVSSSRVIYFKTDAICHNNNGYFCLEHKTTSRFSGAWVAQWRQKVQIGTYIHVLFCLYPEDAVYGVLINGFCPSSPPKLKLNGEPYAGSKDNTFQRVPIRRNLASMESWLVEVNNLLATIDENFNKLLDSSEDATVLEAFPRNTESCTVYGVCPFLDHCAIWHNPIRHASNPPIGFDIQYWDPRTRAVNKNDNIKIEINTP